MARHALLAIGPLDDDRVVFDVGHATVHAQLDARPFQLRGALRRELVAECSQRLLAAVEQQHLRAGRIDAAEVLLQRSPRQLRDLPGHLDAGRPGADHRERQPRTPGLRVLLQLGHLEGAEDARAQLQGIVHGLHPGREACELVVTEVGPRRAGGHDQRVVRKRQRLADQPCRGHRLRLQVKARHVGELDAYVAMLAQHLAQRRCDRTLGQDPGRQLVQQRLEGVVVGAVDQRDLDIGARRRNFAANRPPKPPPTITTR